MRAEIIKKYFQAWINKDIEIVKQTFSENMKISKLCKFQSKAEHYYPYET